MDKGELDFEFQKLYQKIDQAQNKIKYKKFKTLGARTRENHFQIKHDPTDEEQRIAEYFKRLKEGQ
ncbi:hypothetical protein [Sediminitomix flava]|uniref:Uncharacterized protein n=1 Tax=Sediminitomix flava TaxID=379075 RepID=A0A315YWG2_SEDFL|nr:hypothetical protein [Sediminitomix flava]PWJ34110.1 hypothetical protein BC781_11120 [Sediminitomix flava]